MLYSKYKLHQIIIEPYNNKSNYVHQPTLNITLNITIIYLNQNKNIIRKINNIDMIE